MWKCPESQINGNKAFQKELASISITLICPGGAVAAVALYCSMLHLNQEPGFYHKLALKESEMKWRLQMVANFFYTYFQVIEKSCL